MGFQRLSPRKTRRIAQATFLNVEIAVTSGDQNWVELVTLDDRHYRYNRDTGELVPRPLADGHGHFYSCRFLHGEGREL